MATILNPATIDFTASEGNAILKGADWYIEISIENQEDDVTTPIDLTGFEGKCQIRESANSPKIIAPPTITIVNPTLGTFSLSLDDTVTKNIPTTGNTYKEKTRYQYDVILSKGTEVYRVLQGSVEVSPSITKGN